MPTQRPVATLFPSAVLSPEIALMSALFLCSAGILSSQGDPRDKRTAPRCQEGYPAGVRQRQRYWPERRRCGPCPRPLWNKLRTPNGRERCCVAVRRRPQPLVCFVNAPSVDRIVLDL